MSQKNKASSCCVWSWGYYANVDTQYPFRQARQRQTSQKKQFVVNQT